tara:strand:- start:449 stop:2476 length:2028 start_codon:yes stop_codon:yes gene_type:complete
MATDYEALDDDQIVTKLDDCISRSVGYYDSEISQERQKVLEYYTGALPKPAHDGNSKYVSLDVYDTVECMKATLLETFSAGEGTVKFVPQNADDVEMAALCTAYTDYVAHRQNDIFNVMQTAIHDGLLARVGICKAYWRESEDFHIEYFDDVTESELDMLLSQENVELEDSEEDELGLTSGSVYVYRDTSQVAIENIAPEEFLIEPQAKSLDDIGFCAHRTTKTVSELIEEGYDEDLLEKIGPHSDVDMETDPEVLSRHENVSSVRGFNSFGYQDQVRSVTVHECYIDLDIEGDGIAELYKVIKAGNILLYKEKVNRRPFVTFCPIPMPHAFFGSNFADKVIPTQNARTVLTRSILDHAMITNNPRYIVTKGGLTNPKELIDNRVGGIVNATRPDAIVPMQQASLNPFIFQTIKLLDEQLEDTSGVSRISQGTNKDAISKQNSAAMIEQLQTMSQGRQKIIARNFANQFVKPLYKMIYQLVIENEQDDKLVELAGNYVRVSPSKWADRRDVSISLHLGYGERERESQKYLAMHQLFSTDETLSTMYAPENKYALISKIMDLGGIKNVSEYLTDPTQLQPQDPSPSEQLRLEMLQKQIEVTERQTQIAEMKVQMQAQNQALQLQLDTLKAETEFALKSDTMDLKEAQLAHKVKIDEAELELTQQADTITAIASPRG